MMFKKKNEYQNHEKTIIENSYAAQVNHALMFSLLSIFDIFMN